MSDRCLKEVGVYWLRKIFLSSDECLFFKSGSILDQCFEQGVTLLNNVSSTAVTNSAECIVQLVDVEPITFLNCYGLGVH